MVFWHTKAVSGAFSFTEMCHLEANSTQPTTLTSWILADMSYCMLLILNDKVTFPPFDCYYWHSVHSVLIYISRKEEEGETMGVAAHHIDKPIKNHMK